MRWIVIHIYIQILHSWWMLMVANSHHTNQARSPFTSSPSRWSVKFCDLLLFSLANLMHAYFGTATVSFCLCCLVRLYDVKETATIFLDSFILPVQSWSSKISTEPCHMHILVCEESMHPWSRWYLSFHLFSLSVTSRFARQALRNQQSTSTKTWLSCWMRPGWNLDVIGDQQMFLFGVFSCFLCWILPYDKYTLKCCVINVFDCFDWYTYTHDRYINCRYIYYRLWIYPCKKIHIRTRHSSGPIPRNTIEDLPSGRVQD